MLSECQGAPVTQKKSKHTCRDLEALLRGRFALVSARPVDTKPQTSQVRGPRPQLDALVAQKALSLQQAEGFVSEQLLGEVGIDVGYGKPSSLGVPDSSGSKAVDMGCGLMRLPKVCGTATTPGRASLSSTASDINS
jgi:hypothetical protein